MKSAKIESKSSNELVIDAHDRPMKIVILGLPNSGKSQIYNNLTHDYTIVANYPNTTIELRRCLCRIGDSSYEVIDTPGLHSLYIHSEEELKVRDLLFTEKPDVIIQCIDSNRLRQSLILTADLQELGLPIVISLNMIDEASRKGVWIDSEGLSRLLGIPVVESIAVQNKGTKEILEALNKASNGRYGVKYDEIIENVIVNLETVLPEEIYYKRKAVVLGLLNDPYFSDFLETVYQKSNSQDFVDATRKIISEFQGNIAHTINNKRNKWIDNITDRIVKRQKTISDEFSYTFARLSRHPIFGIPILMAIIAIMYFLVVDVAGVVSNWLDVTLNSPALFFLENHISSSLLQDFLIGDYGILTLGLANAVITILPILTMFFLFFNVLEDIGYVSNLIVLINRIFEKLGLSGTSFMPIVLGFGCKTMAVLTTKSIKNPKEKYIAICLISFGVPCAPKMGISISIFGMVGVGAFLFAFMTLVLIDIAVGIMLNNFLKGGEKGSFVQELPVFRVPNPKAVVRKTYYRLYWFLKEAVPIFIAAALVLFLMEKSGLLAVIKSGLDPIIHGLLGLPSQMVEVLLICIARPEAAGAKLINLVQDGTLNHIQSITAVLILLLIPCYANMGVIIKELGSRRGIIMIISIYFGTFLFIGCLNWILVSFVKIF